MSQGVMRLLDAVADPVRLRIVRHLAVRDGASVGELSDAAGVHPNTTRAHLAALEEADVVAREPEPPRGRGRPALRFRLREDAGRPDVDQGGLAEILAAAVGRPRGPGLARLRRIGAGWGRRIARPVVEGVHDGADAVRLRAAQQLAEGLGRLGFRARLHADRVELAGCPCPLVSPDHPATVCVLAQGAADGILASAGLCVRAAQHDPERRRCVLWLRPSPVGAGSS